ncbi:winged helix-turn-helix domain-containing protein [Sphingomonas sp.]|uniref:winged helix-turn-helix domain-containing protein n=1 Tax=Sphingomonas sp. TaxID=28214 RepID=UPI001B20B4B7|nr:winged helix-turn-helix domain-containing protein [Sphingomonas sp.]MBO9713662.1 winged helix-turn-helix domain-containing protein [Sphingomonas sp.]
MSDGDGRIDLAHAPGFALGRVAVRPGTRELVRDDGAVEVLEPRVMQVLVALARADGAIVSRDDLTRLCWEGRVVGEDAINRVISRLRRSAEGIGEGSFAIETITKVGYRLVRTAAETSPPSPAAPATPAAPSRRALVIGGGGALAAAALGGWWLWPRDRGPQPPPADVAGMVKSGYDAMRQATIEGNAAAMGLLTRVTELHPDYADGWGLLAHIYALQSHYAEPRMAPQLADKARNVIARTFSLDPVNAYANGAAAWLYPRLGHWAVQERLLRVGLDQRPDDGLLANDMGITLVQVGRMREAADLMTRAVAATSPAPNELFFHLQCLWGANRMDELDRAMDQAYRLFPLHFAIWFGRYYTYTFTGRFDEAIAMGENLDGRPAGIPDIEIERVLIYTRALKSRAPAEVARAIEVMLDQAHEGAGYAENTIQYLTAYGRLDLTFEVADAYFFNRGFTVPDNRFDPKARTYSRIEDRRSMYLFLPHLAPMRRDPRFAKLVGDLGLERYWRESGRRPDYRT